MDWKLREVVTGSRGGPNRARIVSALYDRPRNPNQLAKDLDLHYKTVDHHLEILTNADILVANGNQYGAVYLRSSTSIVTGRPQSDSSRP